MAIFTPKPQLDHRPQSRSRKHAETSLAGQIFFVVDEKRWQFFLTALDRRPRSKPRLKKLFTESHIANRRP